MKTLQSIDYCEKIVRMDGFFGGWHACLSEEEKLAKQGKVDGE